MRGFFCLTFKSSSESHPKHTTIQVFINFNYKEFDWFFICILTKYFEIRGVVLLHKVQGSFMYAADSTNRMFCAKNKRAMNEMQFNKEENIRFSFLSFFFDL